MAEPPHIEEPITISVAVLPGIFITFCNKNARISDVDIVHTIIGSDCFPVVRIIFRFSPNPSSTTAACSMYFEVKEMPDFLLPFSCHRSVIIIPKIMENTGPPIVGNLRPRNHAGIEIARHTMSPGIFSRTLLMIFIILPF